MTSILPERVDSRREVQSHFAPGTGVQIVDPDRRHPYHGYAAQVTDAPAGHPRWRIVTLTDAGKQVEVYAHTSQLEEA